MSTLNIHSNSHPSIFDADSGTSLLNPENFPRSRVVPNWDDEQQPEVQEENSISPVQEQPETQPETTVEQELEAFRKRLEQSDCPAQHIARMVEAKRQSLQQSSAQPVKTSSGPVDAAHMIQGSVNQRLRKKLEDNYNQMIYLSGDYTAKTEILNRALKSAGVTPQTSPEHLERIVSENPDILRKYEAARDVGNAYKSQINKTGRSLQDAQNAGIDTRDIMADWLHDEEEEKFTPPESLHPGIEALSKKIAETVSKFFGYVKKKLGLGKKDVEQEHKSEELDLSKTSYGPKPYLG